MPSLPAKKCMHPACNQLVRGGSRCSVHQAQRDQEWEARRTQLWLMRQERYADLPWSEFRRIRKMVLAEEPACRACGAAATVADHIRPHRGDSVLFLDRSNLQGLCKRCHDRKTSRQDSWNRKPGPTDGPQE